MGSPASLRSSSQVSIPPSYNNIGLTYNHLGQYDKALEFNQKSLTIELQVFGENHPDIATSYYNIGLVYENLEQYDSWSPAPAVLSSVAYGVGRSIRKVTQGVAGLGGKLTGGLFQPKRTATKK